MKSKIFFLPLCIIVLFLSGCFGLKNASETPSNQSEQNSQDSQILQEEGDINIEEFEADLKVLDDYIDREKYTDARDFGLEIMPKYPNMMRLLSRIGGAYMKLNDSQNALKYFLLASELAENTDINILYNILVLYRNGNDDENEKKYTDIILKLDPNYFSKSQANQDILGKNIDTFQKVGELIELGQYKDARKLLEIELKETPDSGELLNQLGFIQIKDGEYQPAKETLEKAYTITGGKDPILVKNLGIAYHNLHDYDEADKRLREALEKDPGNVDYERFIIHNLASKDLMYIESQLVVVKEILFDLSKDNGPAKEILDQLYKKYPLDSHILTWIGRYYMEEFQYKEAKKWLLKAYENMVPERREDGTQGPNDEPDILFLLGLTEYKLGDLKSAKKYVDECLKKYPENESAQILSDSIQKYIK